MTPLAHRIHAALPQTQCTRCGYPDCAAYAQAVADNTAAINQCPPGGAEGITRLARITGQSALPLSPAHGTEGPRHLAVIDEAWCIGCTLCLDACPTDAIVGSNKLMHTVIEPYCTGCELCIPVCPVDCISLENVTSQRTGWAAWSPEQADTAKKRYEIHSWRRTLDADLSTTRPEEPAQAEDPGRFAPSVPSDPSDRSAQGDASLQDTKRAVIEAALARARAARGRAKDSH